MIELMVTSIPFVLRVLYLKWRKIPVTLYNTHRALFLWFALALIVFFTVFYFHPKSYAGIVPFRIVPVVAERAGTVTAVEIDPGDRVAPGDVLFTTDDRDEQAAVAVARTKLAEIDSQIAAAKTDVSAAKATLDKANAALEQASKLLAEQETLRDGNSPAFRENDYIRAVNAAAARQADVDAAQAALDAAQLQVSEVLPAQRASAAATLDEAKVRLDQTVVRAAVAGTVEQLTLSVGDRAGQTTLGPAMLIVPDEPLMIAAGFPQAYASVLHEGMAAEVMCPSILNISMVDSVLPARITRIQNVIGTGQLAPAGRLLDPAAIAAPGSIVAHFELLYPEQGERLMDGSTCFVQTYTTELEGGGALSHTVATLGVIKAVGLRLRAWISLATGIGLGGSSH